MALGLGQMLGMGLLSNFFGGEDKEGLLQQNQQQPTQVANSGQGFNMNNMTPSQWANTAIALNSMRLEPDANLATAMRERIASGDKRMQGMETAQWLDTQGRTDLSAMVKSGILDPQKALEIAMKKEDIPDWRQKYNFTMKKLAEGHTFSDIEKALLSIPIKQTNATDHKLDLLINPPIDPKTNEPRKWTEDQLQVIGIPKDSQPLYQSKLDKIDSLRDSDPDFKLYSKEEYKEMYKRVLSGGTADTTIDIDMGLDAGDYAKAATADIYKDHKTIIDGLPKLIENIQKVYDVMDILDRADEGEIRTGVFEPLQTMVSRISAGLGLGSGDQAVSMQILQSYMGSDVFPLIRALGIGARGMDTPAEREFLQQSFVGNVTMEVGALRAITERRLGVLLDALDVYNTRASTLTEDGLNSAYFKMYEETFKVRITPREVPVRLTKSLIEQEKEDKNITMDKYF
jgi:hypothetical protein